MTDNRDGAKLMSLAVHEFRTPVSVVAGYLRMLLRHFGENLTDQQRKIVEESERSCGQLSSLLAELSDLANLDAGQLPLKRERVDLAPLLREVAADVHEGQDRGLSLDLQLASRRLDVVGDPARLRDAFRTMFAAVLRERVDAGTVPATCRALEGDGLPRVELRIGEPTAPEAAGAAAGRTFDEYRGGLGFRLVLATRVFRALGGDVDSPNSARGRLSIVVSLPAAPELESTG
jgi:hypothetical protein